MRRRSWTSAWMAAGCALLAAGAAWGQRPAPAKKESYRWVMVEALSIMSQPGGGARIVGLCRRAKEAGYNGLLLWDQNLWRRQLPAPYMENARTLQAGLKELEFALVLKMCPRGWGMIEWSGDPSICEPRPANPTAEERNFRYVCLAHPGVIPIWEDQIRRADRIYGPDGYLLQYDEVRVAGSDRRCRESGKTSAQLLAEHVRQAIAMVRRVRPEGIVAVWNDMFDPHHNAKRGNYYHVKGGFYGAWEGIDRDVLVLNWNDSMASVDFWERRGNRQVICGYYDGELGMQREGDFIRQARRRPGVVGYMYTTWEANFSALKPYLSLSGFSR